MFRECVRRRCAIVFAGLAAAVFSGPPLPAFSQTLQRDGGVKIGNYAARCGHVPARFDPDLPIEGAAVIGEAVVLNPALLAEHPETVRLFIYHHECGHHVVGGSELAADCYAVSQGVLGGWLDRAGVDGVCRSIGDEDASSTHPSGRKRCKNMVKCFVEAAARPPRPSKTATNVVAAKASSPSSASAFRLVREPSLISSGFLAKPAAFCGDAQSPEVRAARDPIGKLIQQMGAGCR